MQGLERHVELLVSHQLRPDDDGPDLDPGELLLLGLLALAGVQASLLFRFDHLRHQQHAPFQRGFPTTPTLSEGSLQLPDVPVDRPLAGVYEGLPLAEQEQAFVRFGPVRVVVEVAIGLEDSIGVNQLAVSAVFRRGGKQAVGVEDDAHDGADEDGREHQRGTLGKGVLLGLVSDPMEKVKQHGDLLRRQGEVVLGEEARLGDVCEDGPQ